jgi:RNA polymerase sigma-70 factor (ECF subfamily)
MAAYINGDAQAFQELFKRLAPSVHRFFLQSFRCTTVADDLLQTTFFKLHRARADYDCALPLRPWLFTIAARVRLDELRRRYNAPPSTSEDELAQLVDERDGLAQTAESAAHLHDRQEAVHDALARLPEPQRVVIHLHRFEGMTFSEIANVLGTTAGAAKLRAFRGYEQLRRQLRSLVEDEVTA